MRYLIFLLSFFFMVGCSDEGGNITSPSDTSTGTAIHLSGKLNLTNAGSINPSNITLSVAGITTHPNSDGSYLLAGNFGNIAARAWGSEDSVKVIIGFDTMIEIPVISWKGILPDAYIVQRNVSCVIPKKHSNKTVEVVYWDNDSIAHVLNIGKTTSNIKYSGYIYTAYNDSQFINHSTIYNLFARIKSDTVVAYTEITNVTANVGNLDYDSTQFIDVNGYVKYFYTVIPNDSSVKKYDDTTFFMTLKADTTIRQATSFNHGWTYDAYSEWGTNFTVMPFGTTATSTTTSYSYVYPSGSGLWYEYYGIMLKFKPSKTKNFNINIIMKFITEDGVDSVITTKPIKFIVGVEDSIFINTSTRPAFVKVNATLNDYDYMAVCDNYYRIEKYWE